MATQQRESFPMCKNEATVSSVAVTSATNVYKTAQHHDDGAAAAESERKMKAFYRFGCSRVRRHRNQNQANAQQNKKVKRILATYRAHIRATAETTCLQEELDYNKVVCTHYSCYSVFAGPIYRTHSFIHRIVVVDCLCRVSGEAKKK